MVCRCCGRHAGSTHRYCATCGAALSGGGGSADALVDASTTDPSLPRATAARGRLCGHCLADNPSIRLLCRRCGHELDVRDDRVAAAAASAPPGRRRRGRWAAAVAAFVAAAGAVGLALDRSGVVDVDAVVRALS